MRVTIAAIGRMKKGPETELVERYLARAKAGGKPLGLTGFDVTESPESRASSAEQRKAEEAEALSRPRSGHAKLIVLDERGKSISSEKLSATIGDWRDAGHDLSVVIGGPDGLDHRLRETADLVLGLSALTWPHQLVRVLLAEQLYRVTTILAGHPYHRS
ncbi:23S rRNA (pseudouridine(1915)-N(3))-methyltransferase RlmH [Cucumibacter marinus]|uniref:23S rRNA (pseudouridine(1915)-N(3))-methyltransferase RlmH n=1 Tax=Cucumibacter marinus TaxID=1121252 RepID=UPI000402DC75|nr:23S rRNA (pseudouridine(1915)-N(3))-methyltransferase RlmH [Cucumibacter marinus]